MTEILPIRRKTLSNVKKKNQNQNNQKNLSPSLVSLAEPMSTYMACWVLKKKIMSWQKSNYDRITLSLCKNVLSLLTLQLKLTVLLYCFWFIWFWSHFRLNVLDDNIFFCLIPLLKKEINSALFDQMWSKRHINKEFPSFY